MWIGTKVGNVLWLAESILAKSREGVLVNKAQWCLVLILDLIYSFIFRG